jgi:hypothetical protein
MPTTAACSATDDNSYRLGREVPFSAKASSFGGNAEAAGHFERSTRSCGMAWGSRGCEPYRLGPMLSFDPASERFTGERADEANALLKDPTNPGFAVPDAGKV